MVQRGENPSSKRASDPPLAEDAVQPRRDPSSSHGVRRREKCRGCVRVLAVLHSCVRSCPSAVSVWAAQLATVADIQLLSRWLVRHPFPLFFDLICLPIGAWMAAISPD